ncbi:aprataxin-like protein [Ceratocystis pirilliformis]|uniref:Aprataxin-like protein n=1 Tax=Ceratocystis pirilliformis TaxID=259994 RepID=A0ABR3YLT4_9PEZI
MASCNTYITAVEAPAAQNPSRRFWRGAEGLGVYLNDPDSFPASKVAYHNKDVIAIHDKYPKSSVHMLLLSRCPDYNLQHPIDALDDAEFRRIITAEVNRLRGLVAKELRRRFGAFSVAEAARRAALDSDIDLTEGQALPAGRDWAKDVIVGIHAQPSMSHLHVHVMSRDMYSQHLKNKKHYNSFQTPFFIDIADFPLAEDDPRRHSSREGYLKKDYKCWRCGADYGNRFKLFKEHLATEFERWKVE